MSAQQNKEDSRQLVYCVACSLMHAARACILSHISRHLYKLVYSLKRVHFLPGSTMMKMKTWLHTGHFAAFPSYAKLIHCKPRVWLSWPLNRWWCEQLYKMMFCFWIKLTDCQSECHLDLLFMCFWNELYRSCFIILTGHECSMTNLPDGQLSESQRLKKLQVVLFLDKFLTHWLKAAALKPPQFFQMPKRLTKAHTSVSQLATCGRLDQRFVKTPLKTFLLLMLHFKGFTCKPPRAVEATTGKCQVVFEQFSKHWFWEWATNIGKLVEQVAHMLLLQRPGTTLGHFPASH